MERLSRHTDTPRGLSAATLRVCGYLCLLFGVTAKGVIQNGLFGLGGMSSEEMLAVMDQSGNAMALVTTSIVLQLLEACAVPVFALLLVEGFQKTSSYKHYLARLGLVAVLSELPYNLAFSGKLLALDSRNPVFALLICLLMLYFYRYCGARSLKNSAIKVVVTASALLWCAMLKIEHGTFLVIMTAALWIIRNKPNFRPYVACGAAALATLTSLLYVVTPFSCMLLHFYNEEKGESNRVFNLLCYPLMLLAAGVVTYFL